MATDKELLAALLEAGEDYLAQLVRHINPNGDGIAPSAGHRAEARNRLLDAVEAMTREVKP